MNWHLMEGAFKLKTQFFLDRLQMHHTPKQDNED